MHATVPRIGDITVVLPTRNEAHNIERFLHSLPDTVALVVVDKGRDSTAEIVARVRPRRTTILFSEGSVTEARQLGAQRCATPTDADVTFDSGYFERLAALRPADVIYGPKLSEDDYRSYYSWFARGQRFGHHLGLPCASGSNLLVTNEAFRAAGGFDLQLTCNEDSELVWRIKARGFACRFGPDLIVWAHDHRRLRRGLWRKTLHSVGRCALLRAGVIPQRWRSHHWGYWSASP